MNSIEFTSLNVAHALCTSALADYSFLLQHGK